jgi:predicted nucleic acid-binding protein
VRTAIVLLAIDASSVVAESLRVRGQQLIADQRLSLLIAAPVWAEVQHELEKRKIRRLLRRDVDVNLTMSSHERAGVLLRETVRVVNDSEYAPFLPEALRRIPRDPSDAPTVALALALDCGIWTADNDFFGCGVAIWATDVLLARLAALPPGDD